MSIFEDLIEELKEENLLEETVIRVGKETSVQSNQTITAHSEYSFSESSSAAGAETRKPHDFSYFETPAAEAAFLENSRKPVDENFYSSGEFQFQGEPGAAFAAPVLPEAMMAVTAAMPEGKVAVSPAEKTQTEFTEREFFRKRAMDEVNGLQMVDHVLSGVEREKLNLTPTPYDDLPVKLALHDFIQIAAETKSTEHAQSEFRLMQETENWYSSLSRRDKNITVANLRDFCENTKPALSPQALIALARFYRNSPYTEQVRSKFDLVVTRLFSGELENEKREQLLEHGELIAQIKELYAEWSSIQLYSTDENDSEIQIIALKFQDFNKEAEAAQYFEALMTSDFFARLQIFKEGCQENYFAPNVAATAVASNIKIGNRFIDLLEKEKENSSLASIEEKYGFVYDDLVSDTVGKTLRLVELLKIDGDGNQKAAEIVDINVRTTARAPYKPRRKARSPIFAANKWLIALTLLTVLVCGGLYFWAEYQSEQVKPSPSVKMVHLENSSLKEYLQDARISDEIFYGVILISWESLNGEKKEDLLRKILSIGGEKGFKKVHLMDAKGKTVGFATAEKVEVFNP